MTLSPDALELRFAHGDYGLSARRLWEHTELGQVNVFSKAISSRQELNDAAEFIDVVCFRGDALSLAGLTLAELKAGRFPLNGLLRGDSVLAGLAQAEDAATFVGFVAKHVDRCSVRLATRNQLDAVAWTRGEHQVLRYKRLGATGLIELYDRTLPREVNRMVKHLGCVCENLGVFVPTNFSIKQSESGYDVYTPQNELLGTAQTLEKARQFAPDGGHELLYEVHGVRLPDAVRKAIRGSGFPAWG